MKLKANIMYKPGNFQMDDCQVEKVVELPVREFYKLVTVPLEDHPVIAENKKFMFSDDGVMHCLLALGEGFSDGILIDSEQYNFARHAAYLTGARDIVNARIEQAADFIVRQGTGNTSTGSWSIHINELEKQLGLTVREGNGLDKMLLDALARRDEVSDVHLAAECISADYHPRFCRQLHQKEISARFSLERTAELFSNAMTSVRQLYDGRELYSMLHDSFGLSLQEIRDHGYLADSALAEIGALPRRLLENVMCVRDILHVDTPRDTFLVCGPDKGGLPLEYLSSLTELGRESYAALLDAEVMDIRSTNMGIELVLDGVGPEELARFIEDHEAHEATEQAMGQSM